MRAGCLLPGMGSGSVALFVHCFLDDSGKESQPTNPFVVMAGYFAEMSVWLQLWQQWANLLVKHQITSVHMKELIPIEGEYKKLGWDIEKRDAAIADFIEEIRKAPVIGIGVAVKMTAWRTVKAANPKLPFGTVQEFVLQRILRGVVERLAILPDVSKVALVFDRDPEFAANRIKVFSWLLSDPKANKLMASIMFADPHVYPGLQCADILAWETRKELVQKAGSFGSTRRWRAIFERMPEYHLDYMGEFWDEDTFKANHFEQGYGAV